MKVGVSHFPPKKPEKSIRKKSLEVHLDTPLMESGLDSLSAVAFRNELSKTFQGIGALPAALMFDYPSVRAITEHIVDRSKGLA